jgi:ribonuclease G
VQGLKLDIIVRTNAENASMEQLGAEVEKLCSRLCAMLSHANVQSAFTRLYSGDDGCLEDVKNLRGSRLEKIITDLPEVYSTIRDYLLLNEPASVEKLELYDDPTLPLEKLYNLGGQITAALKERVWLPSGGYLVIEPTEALTVIDVNTGKFTGNRKLQKNTYMIINRQAAQEIARQLVLRNLSGIIIVDFINLESPQENKELLAYLSELLRLDPVQATVVGMTRLGLVEITRKKVKKPLHEMFKGILQPSP